MLRVSLDALQLDDGWLATSEVRVSQTDVLKAPEPTALKEYHRVRVAFDNEHVGGQVWQYGVVRYVHARQAQPPGLEREPLALQYMTHPDASRSTLCAAATRHQP